MQKETDLENGIKDAALIILIKNGDKKAEGALFLLCKNKMYRVAYGYYRNRQDAEDAYMEAFDMAMVAMMDGSYIEKNHFEQYVCAIIHNKFLNGIRNRHTMINYDELLNNPESLDEDDGLKEERKERIRITITTLSQKRQDLYNLRVKGKKGYNEIGELLGISPKSASSEFEKILQIIKSKIS